MKTKMTRYTVVTVIVFIAIAGAYGLAMKAGLISGRIASAAHDRAAMDKAPMKRKAVLLEAGLGREEQLQSCYETFLRKQPQIDEGTVEVHWLLDGHGRISSMEMVHSDLEDEAFLNCLDEKIRMMTFRVPPQGKPTLVTHKFNFHKRTPATLDFKQASDSRIEE